MKRPTSQHDTRTAWGLRSLLTKRRVRRYTTGARILGTLASVLATLTLLAADARKPPATSVTISFLTASAALAGAAYGVQRLSERRRREELENRVEILQAASPQDIASMIVDTEERRLAAYIERRAEAEKEIAPYLPDNPRRAKRLLNHERLYGNIAEDRDVFGGTPDLTYRHLTKWVLILETWPRLGAALTRNPTSLAALEQSVSLGQLQTNLEIVVAGATADTHMLDILRRGEQLSPVLARLVHFEPSGTPKGSGGTARAEAAPGTI